MRKYYEHQENALRATAQLGFAIVALFVGTVLLSGVVVTYLLLLWYMFNDGHPFDHVSELFVCFGMTTTFCLCIVISGSVLKMMQLRAGGRVIARDLRGTLIEKAGQDLNLLKLLNIVDEMSIASGIPTPPVYVLEHDRGINAFAAGYELSDAVIGVTRGAIENLTREQLQGVIAHEFSHILNGDMRLNLRMIGVLHGILCMATMSKMLIESANAAFHARTERELCTAGLGVLCYILAVVLWPIGIVGALLSLFVKSATSRHREYLADAFAVQFTRNPEGIGGALKRIAGHKAGSRVRSPNTMEASHMFFANGCASLRWMFASHPPIERRILRLEPDWDGVALFREDDELGEYTGVHSGAMGMVAHGKSSRSVSIVDRPQNLGLDSDSHTEHQVREYSVVSNVRAEQFIEDGLDRLPQPLMQIVSAADGTPLVMFALWVLHSKKPTEALDLLSDTYRNNVSRLLPTLESLHESQHILLLDTALEYVNLVVGTKLQDMQATSSRLIKNTETENMFQWMWGVIVGPRLGLIDPTRQSRYGRLSEVAGACEILLSRICHAGTAQESLAQFSFGRACSVLGINNIQLRPASDCTWQKFKLAVDVVSQLAAGPRRLVLVACSSAMTSDSEISCDESYLIRGVCQQLGYVVPQVLPGQPVTPGA